MGFSSKTRSRCWVVTCQIANFIKAGLIKRDYENYEFLAKFLVGLWENSGNGRKAAFSICISEKGLYHAHGALYGNVTTLKKVADVFFQSHVEPQLGGKKELRGYLEKTPPYDEKGEIVLFTFGLENIEERQGKRSDLDSIEEMLNNGSTPQEILAVSFSFRRYEKGIKSDYIDRRLRETPLIKEMKCEYIFGKSGVGKSYEYKKIAEKEGIDNIYFMTDYHNGGLDFYMTQGAPHILFIDDFKGGMPYSTLLMILDKYSRGQIHSRYTNCFCLWDSVIITSVYSPEEAYEIMVSEERRDTDTIVQFLRRLNTITYKYVEGGEYKSYSIPANEYKNAEDLIAKANDFRNGFVKVEDNLDIPFKE